MSINSIAIYSNKFIINYQPKDTITFIYNSNLLHTTKLLQKFNNLKYDYKKFIFKTVDYFTDEILIDYKFTYLPVIHKIENNISSARENIINIDEINNFIKNSMILSFPNHYNKSNVIIYTFLYYNLKYILIEIKKLFSIYYNFIENIKLKPNNIFEIWNRDLKIASFTNKPNLDNIFNFLKENIKVKYKLSFIIHQLCPHSIDLMDVYDKFENKYGEIIDCQIFDITYENTFLLCSVIESFPTIFLHTESNILKKNEGLISYNGLIKFINI